ncbi:MAG: hypothetical protein GYB55_15330 [Cytophagales bacterium]|uniref:hypothetical protein n=1 Tax=Cyclobacterium marinum TaxID=104 RepID=UPI0030DCC98F|nr:hypothetical protein [Cytophagales bacterium]|tara:strand:- start:1416 stop:1649 length:234 start_codon:yes stop_codon:yes gene_type:complete
MKVTNSVEKITPFGGFNFVIKVFGLADLVNKHLGSREKTFGFSYSDIFANPLAEYLNGGHCTEGIIGHLRDYFLNVR